MSINPIRPVSPTVTSAVSRARQVYGAAQPAPVSGADSLDLSSSGRLFAEALKAAAALPEVRADRVQAAEAQPTATARDIAAKMLAGLR